LLLKKIAGGRGEIKIKKCIKNLAFFEKTVLFLIHTMFGRKP
jgi:hypothetical protein